MPSRKQGESARRKSSRPTERGKNTPGRKAASKRPARSFQKSQENSHETAKRPGRKGRFAKSGRPHESDNRSRKKGVRNQPGAAHRSQPKDIPLPAQPEKIRLNKYIANSGISSRREADELIKMGLISVNGKVVTELGYKVSKGDEVRYENKVLKAERPVYILLNKPKGFITTTDDPQERKTVMHIIGNAVKERIYPVGRLDRNTTGLLLLTNDGDLADKLMHPSFNVKKIYKVELNRPLAKKDFQKIIDGVHLEEGRAVVDDLAIVSDDGRTVGIELHIGWNRVVRRIFESLDYEVLKLDRTAYAGLDKKELARGQWRFLSKEEIIRLKHFK